MKVVIVNQSNFCRCAQTDIQLDLSYLIPYKKITTKINSSNKTITCTLKAMLLTIIAH